MSSRKVWRCWSCGKELPNGTNLDCKKCERMLREAKEELETREFCRFIEEVLMGGPVPEYVKSMLPMLRGKVVVKFYTKPKRIYGPIAQLRDEMEGMVTP